MNIRMSARLLGSLGLTLVACGGAAVAPSPSPSATATANSTPSPTPAASTASPGVWTITSDSKATVSVREQLVGLSLPSDAILVANGATGSFTVNADGTFSTDSKISFDLTTLKSDQSQRDSFVKQSVLQTRQFPTATFVPVNATGLASPIASGADLKFQMSGTITIRGITKDVTFDVVAKRSGGQLRATATAAPTWKFGDFGMQPPAIPGRVLSVVDEIHLVVDLVATGPAA